MKLQQVSGVALLGVALSLSSTSTSALDKLVAAQPIKAIEKDENYSESKHLNGWGWNQNASADVQKLKNSNSLMTVNSTTDGGTQTSPPAQVNLPQVTQAHQGSRFFRGPMSSIDVYWDVDSTETTGAHVYRVFANEDGRGWRQKGTTYDHDIDISVSVEKSLDVAVQPCVQTDSTTECGEKVPAGMSFRVPASGTMGWSGIIETMAPNFGPNGRVTELTTYLGKAYDAVREGVAPNKTCFAQDVGENAKTVPGNGVEQEIILVDTRRAAASFLDIKNTLKGSATFSGIESKDNLYKYKLFNYATSASHQATYLGKFVYSANKLVARSSSELHVSPQYQAMLINAANAVEPSDKQGYKESFRTECGDQYVDSIEIGKEIYFSIRMLKEKSSNYKLTENKEEFKIEVESLMEGGFSYLEKQALLEKYSNYVFEIKSTAAGASFEGNITNHMSLGGFLDYLESFSQSGSPHYTVIGMTATHYPTPSAITHLPLREVFLDYYTPLDNISKWALFHNQVEERCGIYGPQAEVATISGTKIAGHIGKIFNSGLNRFQNMICDNVREAVSAEYANCLAQGEWKSCLAGPRDSQCYISGEACLDYATDIYYTIPVEYSSLLEEYQGDCHQLSGECVKIASTSACLATPDQVLDYRVNYDVSPTDVYDRVAPGVKVIETDLWYVSSLNTALKWRGRQACATLDARLVSKGYRKNTSRYKGELTIYGFDVYPNTPYQ
ncbi:MULTISPECIES: hypothetical protein [Pseudoalteromonas]|uniref:Uncharacterized protein n=1 Tax=Pseudoalteromonas amylolytica TaxID=1859457 RepID=A0A1S1MW74_9GAMM|nr:MULTISPECIES: hypothetical protein [Pseudoalteromonas]OHU88041.1 hypothetical protein BFC16_11650 [Pseudoalteromonas sp. JW3]OHU91481.1 hypothetical protein BET10_11770 [Pseudoalteromonas amylolytica]